MKKLSVTGAILRVLLVGFACAACAIGQPFSSGSTGSDGVLDLTSGDRVVALPPSGILNYTTVNIPVGKTLAFQPNLKNTPAIMLAQGNVTINGTINISASGRTPGPGGFYGGDNHQNGFGPGGGVDQNYAGRWVGPLSLVPIIGGSGGAGLGGVCFSSPLQFGGGGGGAFLLASSGAITVGGVIVANGATAGITFNGCQGFNDFEDLSGAPGAIRLVANALTITGNLQAAVVRLEGPLGAVSYTGSGTNPVVSTINSTLVPSNPPTLTIISVGGYPVPSYSGSSFSTIDLLLPTQLPDPIPVVVQATNVPVGSPVSIAFGGPTGTTSTTANLAGTNASSAATVYISGVSRTGISYLFASTTFSATLIASNLEKTNPSGISKIEVAAAPGQKPKYRFLRDDGSEVGLVNIPADIRRLFGL